MILKWKEFITEKLSQNEVLDLYNHFIRILKIHEDFFHHDTQISNDSNFKGDINRVFHKLMIGKKPFTEELFNLVGDYENKLYGEVKIAPEESYGCSMWDVCEVILEDPDTIKYIHFKIKKLIMKNLKNYNEFINENTVIETKNVANNGDWIIKAKTVAGEEYVLKEAKFPKLYDINSAKIPQDKSIANLDYMEYNTIPETRTALICNQEVIEKLINIFGNDVNKIISQKDMLENIQYFKEDFISVNKKESAYAKQVKNGPVEVITRVQKGKPEQLYFEPSWGGSMPICEDDILIVNTQEIYRIARSEFNQTYDIK